MVGDVREWEDELSSGFTIVQLPFRKLTTTSSRKMMSNKHLKAEQRMLKKPLEIFETVTVSRIEV